MNKSLLPNGFLKKSYVRNIVNKKKQDWMSMFIALVSLGIAGYTALCLRLGYDENVKQVEVVGGQLANEKMMTDYTIRSNAPYICLASFQKENITDTGQYFSVTFKNIGNRSCTIERLRLSVANSSVGYDTTITNKANRRLYDKTLTFTKRYCIPQSVANDVSTLYYYEILGKDNLLGKRFVDTLYFKNVDLENYIAFPNDGYEETDFYIMSKYVAGDNRRLRLDMNSPANEKWIIPQTSVFNRDAKDSPTVTVSDYNTGACKAGPATGCWKSSLTASVGDVVSVQIYFHNCGKFTARDVAAGLTPEETTSGKTHLFSGVIAEANGIVRGQAEVIIEQNTILSFIKGSVRLYVNQKTTPHTIDGEKYLFSSDGINIGDIKAGWGGQGTLVANFKVIQK